MSRLFDRDYVLRVDALEITRLDIAFRVQRTLKAHPNKAEIRVWNLNQEHRGELDRQRDRLGKKQTPVHVELEVGYAGSRHLIYSGDLTIVYSEHDGPDIVTYITSGDGSVAWKTSRVNFGVSAGTQVKDTLKKIAKSMTLGKGNLDEVLRTASLPNVGATFSEGTTVSGAAREEFSRLADAAGFEWSIQNGVIQVKEKGKPLTQSAIRLTPESGLIGSPTVETSPPNPGKTKKQEKAVKCRALMIPGMVPGRKVQLESESFDGTYEITEVMYQGDTAGQEWGADLKLRPAA
jgi:hypothetical protein